MQYIVERLQTLGEANATASLRCKGGGMVKGADVCAGGEYRQSGAQMSGMCHRFLGGGPKRRGERSKQIICKRKRVLARYVWVDNTDAWTTIH